MFRRTGYIIYFFSLFAAYMVYWLFSLQSVITFISFLSFLAAVLHFGISSWLFFFFNKAGRILSLTTAVLLLIWPIQTAINSIIDKEYSLLPYYLLPVVFSIVTSVLHIKNLTTPVVVGNVSRYILAAIAFILFLIYVIVVTSESIKEGALIIVF
jgi:hypothetical protein